MRFLVGLLWIIAPSVLAQPTSAPTAPAVEEADAPKAKPKKPPPPPGKVRVTFTTRPEVNATVHWGRKVLCTTPCSILRKENSGPLDVVFKKSGYLTVNTRAFTFKSDYVAARMTGKSQAYRIYGFKEPVEEDEEGQEEE